MKKLRLNLLILWIIALTNLDIQAQSTLVQQGTINLNVNELTVTEWNSPKGIEYQQVPGANLGATSFEIMDDNRTVFLCNSNNEIVITNVNGEVIKRFNISFVPRDFTYDSGYFFVLTENQVIQYDEMGNKISNFSFPDIYAGVERLTRYNNATYLLLPNGNTLLIESNGLPITSQEKEGWITQTGDFVLTSLTGDYSYSVKVITKDYKTFEKTFTADRKVAGAFVIGSTNNRVVLDVQTFISEKPISVERKIVVINLNSNNLGDIITSTKVPDMYYVLTNKDFSVSKDGTIYNMVTAPQGAYVFSLTEITSVNAQGYPLTIIQQKYNFNNHLIKIDNETEVEKKTNVPLNALGTITRDQIISNAIPYTSYIWTATSSNIWNGVSCGGKIIQTPPWVQIGSNTGMPYCWGGWTSTSNIQAYLNSGKSAGDNNTETTFGAEPSCAVGLDCSGFISRAWELSTKYSTSTLPYISTSISLSQTQPGDILNTSGHVRLVETNYGNGYYLVIESSARDWKTSTFTYTAAQLSSYDPRKYNNVIEDICTPVSITTQPINQTVTAGNTATFSVTVNGTGPFSYFWYKNNSQVSTTSNSSSATNSYTTPVLTTSNNGDNYYCLINNCSNQNQAQSNTVYVTVNSGCTPVTITSTSTDQTVTEPAPASFNVGVAGTGPTFQWQYSTNGGTTWNNVPNSSPYSGITSSTLNINPTAVSMNGYKYRCQIGGSCTTTYLGNWVTLTVNAPSTPTITVSTDTLSDFGNVVMDEVSDAKNYTVSGSNLTSTLIITPPNGFEVAMGAPIGFTSNPLYITGDMSNITIYVRFHPTALQLYSGTISHTSTGATSQYVAVSGTGSASVYTITTSSNPSNGGTTSGGGQYSNGENVTVTASHATGWNFVNWTENNTVISTDTSYSFSVSSDRNFIANFSKIQYTVTTSSNPSNGGTAIGGGLFFYGDTLTVGAVPYTGWKFKNWSENNLFISDSVIYSCVVDANRNFVGNFDYITGVSELSSVNNNVSEYYVANNFPNPFNPQTSIEFGIPEESVNTLRIFNITGGLVKVVVQNKVLPRGQYSYKFNAENLPSGVYIYVLTSSSIVSNKTYNAVKKMILLK